jgi:hypothetical protein
VAIEIYDRVQDAYHWRSAVVHGDAPDPENVRLAFFGVEAHLLRVWIGFLTLLSAIQSRANPQSIRALRREIAARVDLFFWAPELA